MFKNENQSPEAGLKRVAIYVRKSTTMGLEQDFNSLDAQVAACRAYITSQAGNNWTEKEVFSDGGISGATMDRPGLQRMLQEIKSGNVDIVCFYKFDRLSRNLRDFYELTEFFEKNNVTFVSVSQQLDTSSSTGRMVMNILASFAQFEREMTRERIRDKFEACRKNGLFIGGTPPYGFLIRDRKLVPDPATAPKVARLFELFVRHGSTKAVAKIMNDEKNYRFDAGDSRSKTGETFWRQKSVFNALRNPRYCGMSRYHDRLVKAQHDAIVGKELFDKVQAVLDERSAARGDREKRVKHMAELQGRVFCGNCGCALTYKEQRRKTGETRWYSYYCCTRSSATAEDKCPVKTIPGSLLEAQVRGVIQKAMFTSIEYATFVADGTEIPRPVILSGVRNEGAFWSQLDAEQIRKLVRFAVRRVTVFDNMIDVVLDTAAFGPLASRLETIGHLQSDNTVLVQIPIRLRVISGEKKVKAKIEVDGNGLKLPSDPSPLLRALARSYAWISLFDKQEVKTVSDLQRKVGYDHHLLRDILKMAFISPKIQKAIIHGQEPPGLSLGKIYALKTDNWEEQERILGIA